MKPPISMHGVHGVHSAIVRDGIMRGGTTYRGIRRTALALFLVMAVAGCSTPDGPAVSEAATTAPEEIAAPQITLNGPGQLLPVSAIADVRETQIELEVAETSQQQALGLMFRSALPDNRGMLFPLGNPRRARFWMKDVPVPLDIVFLRDSEVIAIAAQVPPCAALPCPSYGPETELVNQVIELRGGRAAEIGLQPGDTVRLRYLTPNNL